MIHLTKSKRTCQTFNFYNHLSFYSERFPTLLSNSGISMNSFVYKLHTVPFPLSSSVKVLHLIGVIDGWVLLHINRSVSNYVLLVIMISAKGKLTRLGSRCQYIPGFPLVSGSNNNPLLFIWTLFHMSMPKHTFLIRKPPSAFLDLKRSPLQFFSAVSGGILFNYPM